MTDTPAPRIILASASPRRRELLRLIGLRHRVSVSGLEETPAPGETPSAFARRAAEDKAAAVAAREPELPVLAADTVVEVDGRILGKPASEEEARKMLAALSGRWHHVHTGMAARHGERRASLVDTTSVRFAPLGEHEIAWYVSTGEVMDKAGAYAVQGAGGLLVESIDGSPHTVVGLPVQRLGELLARCGLDLMAMLTGTPSA